LNNCTLGALFAVVITGFLTQALMPSKDPDKSLVNANKALSEQVVSLQSALLDATKSSDKVYADAIASINKERAELETAKKNLEEKLKSCR
jgi:hypothetical protein